MKEPPVIDFASLATPPESASIIRVTERQQFKACRRRWKYAYRERLQPRDTKSDARTLGTVLHASLASFYRTLLSLQKIGESWDLAQIQAEVDYWDAWDANISSLEDEQIILGEGMLKGYLRRYSAEHSKRYVLFVEHTFYAKIPGTRVWLSGTPDVGWWSPSQGIWIDDHKGYRVLLTEEQVQEYDDQQGLYIWLLRQNGINVRGSYYNQIRKSVPREPGPLKNGLSLSKNKNILTDKETYMAAILRHGFDIADYEDFLRELPEKEFFRREKVVRSHGQLLTIQENLQAEARDMTYKNVEMYPNFRPMDCPRCDFTTLCHTEQSKGDVEMTKKHLYRVVDDITLNRRES